MSMVITPYGSAPGRECGSCTMCCKVYTFPEINKPAGVWCKFCNPGKGCKIYDNVPDPCRDFFCLWMTDGTMPDEWRPDRARFVLTVYPDERLRLWPGRSRIARRVAQGALL